VPYHAILTLDRRAAHARLENTPFTQVAELWTTSLNRVASAELAAALKNIAYNYPPISLQNQDAQAATGDKNAAVPTQAASAHDVSLVMAVFLAFLGGVILNFMPCVLPVISLKLMGFARLAESDVTRERNLAQNPLQRPRLSLARIEMGAIFIGIVVSFLLLGLVLAGLKLGGVAVGWGMQFQQPIFLAVMTVILLVFSANLLGLFTIPLPLGMNRIFTWVGFGIGSGYGQKIERRRSKIWLKAMGTGILSTLLATPCSAPLVGTALTYALSRQTSEILSIFTAMGVGFAAFYGLAFLVPGLGKFMPKPGAWTVRLRQILGVIMLLSAVWMGYLWISALMPSQTSQNPNDTTAQLSTNTLIWQEFTPQKLANLQAQHRVIMVDVTARWCLTCKANEVLVLNTSKTYELLTKAHVALLRADWTHPNPMIADYLAQNHRYGIPFNAIYRPNSGKTQGATPPILLPEILTFDALQQAVTAAQ
ncbi:MAG: thioredoxin family protein, partial [Alphaproteobacteria bacterium]|nr:thioredoxin family protein [Alphaproteobacteria bacterium]